MKIDLKTNEPCIDVLIGKKGRNTSHAHIGIDLNQSLHFVEPRDSTTCIRPEIDNKQRSPR
jgi:hypothetical protein